jgi:hypothetical protein
LGRLLRPRRSGSRIRPGLRLGRNPSARRLTRGTDRCCSLGLLFFGFLGRGGWRCSLSRRRDSLSGRRGFLTFRGRGRRRRLRRSRYHRFHGFLPGERRRGPGGTLLYGWRLLGRLLPGRKYLPARNFRRAFALGLSFLLLLGAPPFSSPVFSSFFIGHLYFSRTTFMGRSPVASRAREQTSSIPHTYIFT